jgi:hypothetical protein
MITYILEVSYNDGRCYSAETSDTGAAERVIRELDARPDVIGYAVRMLQAGRQYAAQVFHGGKCTVYVND